MRKKNGENRDGSVGNDVGVTPSIVTMKSGGNVGVEMSCKRK